MFLKGFDKGKDPSTSFYNVIPRKPESSTKFFEMHANTLYLWKYAAWFPRNLGVSRIQGKDLKKWIHTILFKNSGGKTFTKEFKSVLKFIKDCKMY